MAATATTTTMGSTSGALLDPAGIVGQLGLRSFQVQLVHQRLQLPQLIVAEPLENQLRYAGKVHYSRIA